MSVVVRRFRHMPATTSIRPDFAEQGVRRGEVDVLGLADEDVLATVAEHRTRARHAEVAELGAVAAYADRHRVTEGEWLTKGALSREGREMAWDLDDHPARAADLAHEAGELGTEGIVRLLGEGAFSVREFAVTDLAVTLELSEHSARAYVAQAVELRDRLPRLWAQVMDGRCPVWKARRVAEQTIPLKAATARFVDAQLAEFAHRISLARITKAVEAAIIRHQPEVAEKKAADATEHRGVWLEADTLEGLTDLRATLDSPDAHAFNRALDETATTLGALGDGSPRDVRRARAVGVLADPQYALDLHTTATAAPVDGNPKVTRTKASPVFHLHLHADGDRSVFGPVARVHAVGLSSWRPGPLPTAVVERWLQGLTPGAHLTTVAVVDLAEQVAVDAYEHPAALQRQVAERDHTCAFPWCGRSNPTYDLDHIEPYVDPDEGGPPGQTSTSNTARLCRYHHRVKTHGAWHYRRTGPTAVTWTSPQGRTYTVDHTGTTAH